MLESEDPVLPNKPSVRLDFYQTEADIVVSVFLKHLKPEDVEVEYSTESVR